MARMNPLFLTVFAMIAMSMSAPSLRAQVIFTVNLNTTGLSGTPGGLAFDLISADNASQNNTAIISPFTTNGSLVPGNNTNTGVASGNLPGAVNLKDSGFTESFRGLTFGTSLAFNVSLTNNFVAPGSPDEFSFFVTNSANTDTVVTTSDPTGANALFTFDMTGSGLGSLTVFVPSTPGVSYTVTSAQANVPEPSGLVVPVAGLAFAGFVMSFRRLRNR